MTNELRKKKLAQTLRENLMRRKKIIKAQERKEVSNDSQNQNDVNQNDQEKI